MKHTYLSAPICSRSTPEPDCGRSCHKISKEWHHLRSQTIFSMFIANYLPGASVAYLYVLQNKYMVVFVRMPIRSTAKANLKCLYFQSQLLVQVVFTSWEPYRNCQLKSISQNVLAIKLFSHMQKNIYFFRQWYTLQPWVGLFFLTIFSKRAVHSGHFVKVKSQQHFGAHWLCGDM